MTFEFVFSHNEVLRVHTKISYLVYTMTEKKLREEGICCGNELS